MNPSGTANLSRSKSGGAEKRAPPPIRPKPSGLSAAATTTTPTDAAPAAASVSPPSSTASYRSGITVTDNGAPTSSSFGDLKRAFERQQNAGPLFVGNTPSGSRIGGGTSTGSIHNNLNNSAGTRTSLQASPSALLGVPSLNNRPRSVSSPAPPLREDEIRDAQESASGEGIDKSQPDFGNLRARFQSQASLSNVSLPKPVRTRCRCVVERESVY